MGEIRHDDIGKMHAGTVICLPHCWSSRNKI